MPTAMLHVILYFEDSSKVASAMPGSKEDAEMEKSVRSAGKSCMSKNTFGQSQNLRQERVRDLRGIIASEREAATDEHQRQEETSTEEAKEAKKERGREENKEARKQVAGKHGVGVGGGKLGTLAETFAKDEEDVVATGKNGTKRMNQYLWDLGDERLRAGCDTSLAPSRDNQGEGAGGDQHQHHLFRDATAKVLTARDVIDRRSLLEYSVVSGKANHFRDLARWLRWKLDVEGLVNQLREPDANGAPLLFQAATTSSCFQAAIEVILDTLGVGGLTQQVRAVDRKGKTLLMYAARLAVDVGVFESAYKQVKDLMSKKQERLQLGATDGEGRTLLHHAAEGRSEEMLSEVIKTIKRASVENTQGTPAIENGLWEKLSATGDRNGWTPALCALGRRGTPKNILFQSLRDLRPRNIPNEVLRQNLNELLSKPSAAGEPAHGDGDVDPGIAAPTAADGPRRFSLGILSRGLSGLQLERVGEEQDIGGERGALIGLMHAARGGYKAFKYVLDVIDGGHFDDDDDDDDDDDNNDEDNDDERRSPQPAQMPRPRLLEVLGLSEAQQFEKRRTMLFAQAALGGQPGVLNRVAKILLPTVEAPPSDQGRYWATKRDYPMHESDIMRAARLAWVAGETFADDDRVVIDLGPHESKSDTGTASNANSGKESGIFTASLFTLAILSGSERAVRWVANFIRENAADHDQVWNILRGEGSEVSSLAYATAASGAGGDGGVFKAVCTALRDAAKATCGDREAGDTLFRSELLEPGSNPGDVEQRQNRILALRQDVLARRTRVFTPLAAAAFSGNDSMFDMVLDTYQKGIHFSNGGGGEGGADDVAFWNAREFPKDRIVAQIKAVLADKKRISMARTAGKGAAAFKATAATETSLLLRGCYGPGALQSAVEHVTEWEQGFLTNKTEAWLGTVVEEAGLDDPVAVAKDAAKEGAFDGLKRLIEKGWDCRDYIATIISDIADYESGVIDTILCAIENSSNPFVTSAIVSTCIWSRARYHPRDRNGLTKLHGEMDALSTELLDKLPHTVRGVGLELLGSFSYLKSDAEQHDAVDDGSNECIVHTALCRRRQAIKANLVGFIAVRWMLEPSLNNSPVCGYRSDAGSEMDPQEDLDPLLDPLQQALNRGSVAHAFINAPLVLDYMELKWSCTVPSWARRNPLDYTINEGFYTYTDTDTSNKDGKQKLSASDKRGGVGRSDTTGATRKHNGDGDGRGRKDNAGASGSWQRLDGSLLRLLQGWDREAMMVPGKMEVSAFQGFPHTTVLPGLQFILAGLIGKPDIFFLVPFVRFMFETNCYLFMLGLYISCVSIDESGVIPLNEIFFYIFAAGLTWREILEFRDALPRPRPTSTPESNERGEPQEMTAESVTRVEGGPKLPRHRATTGVKRYFAKDNWNILDTASILFVLITFICRMVAYIADFSTAAVNILGNTLIGQSLFVARFFLAAMAPLLCARVLSLAQVDNTLGPMTQIIWAMLFHLARFSIFMLVVMCSFALAFHSLFSSPNCGDGDELYEVYSTFHDSLLDMFRAMLGDTSFDRFQNSQNPTCNGPSWEFDAGVFLLVTYIVIMAILMLNLLIAILSTVHDKVSENSVTEFHLARCQFIQASAGGVEKGLLPPPFNLFMVLLMVVVDFVGEGWHLFRKCVGYCGGSAGQSTPAAAPFPAAAAPAALSEEKQESKRDAPAADTSGAPSYVWGSEFSEVKFDESADRGAGGDRDGQDGTLGVPHPKGDHNRRSNTSSGDGFKPLSDSPRMKTLRGALERLLFACTMGVFAVGVNALLWAVSLLSVAGRIVRWMMVIAGQKDRLPPKQPGYFRPLIFGVIGLLASLAGLLLALVFCSSCVALSVVLWFRGVWRVFQWEALEWENETAKQDPSSVLPRFPDTGRGAVMPGAVRTALGLWQDAARVVEASNHGPSKEKERTSMWGRGSARRSEAYPGQLWRHFDVEALLKMTTGWSMDHLSSLVRLKEEESRKEEAMLREIDDKTPHLL